MNQLIKSASRPFIKFGLNVLEQITHLKTDPTGFLPNRSRMLTNSYESFLINTILSKLPERGGVFVDIGANVGYISRRIAEQHPTIRRIVAVEPNPRLHPILSYNLKKFPSCEILQVGLGSQNASLEFYHGKDSAVGSFVKGYNEIHHSNNPAYKTSSIVVPVRVGDKVFDNLEMIDIMKIDVEGFEMEVFKGLTGMFKKAKIQNIAFEFRPLSQTVAGEAVTATIDFLQGYGYKIYGLEDAWKDVLITEKNMEQLTSSLGEFGYSTLLATIS